MRGRSETRPLGDTMPIDVATVDAGLAALALGLLVLLKPRRLRPRIGRRPGVALVLAGLVVFAGGLALPVRPVRLPGPPMALDTIVPVYQFGEHHEIRIAAPPECVYAALRAVTAREIRLFRLLTWLRSPRLPGRGEESILNPADDEPILQVATRSGFVLLHDDPPNEIVFGAIVCCEQGSPPAGAEEFRAREGSLARAVMTFHAVAERGGATRLITQTRVHTSDAVAERRFAPYWRLIYSGSALLRRMWLRAVKARAEASTPSGRAEGTVPWCPATGESMARAGVPRSGGDSLVNADVGRGTLRSRPIGLERAGAATPERACEATVTAHELARDRKASTLRRTSGLSERAPSSPRRSMIELRSGPLRPGPAAEDHHDEPVLRLRNGYQTGQIIEQALRGARLEVLGRTRSSR